MSKIIFLIIGILTLSSCATTKPRGSLTMSTILNSVPVCPKDRKVIYENIIAEVNWEVGTVELRHSWQCTKIGTYGDTYRVYEVLGEYPRALLK